MSDGPQMPSHLPEMLAATIRQAREIGLRKGCMGERVYPRRVPHTELFVWLPACRCGNPCKHKRGICCNCNDAIPGTKENGVSPQARPPYTTRPLT